MHPHIPGKSRNPIAAAQEFLAARDKFRVTSSKPSIPDVSIFIADVDGSTESPLISWDEIDLTVCDEATQLVRLALQQCFTTWDQPHSYFRGYVYVEARTGIVEVNGTLTKVESHPALFSF